MPHCGKKENCKKSSSSEKVLKYRKCKKCNKVVKCKKDNCKKSCEKKCKKSSDIWKTKSEKKCKKTYKKPCKKLSGKKCRKTCKKSSSSCKSKKSSSCKSKKSSSCRKPCGNEYRADNDICAGKSVRLEYDFSCKSARARSLLPDPSFKWTHQSITSLLNSATSYSITADNLGNIYVAGTFLTSITLGTFTLNASSETPFVAKLDYNGEWVYAVKPVHNNLSGTNSAVAITVDKANNVFVTGAFQGNLQWGALPVLSSPNDSETWILKINPAGTFIWSTQTVAVASTNTTNPNGIAVDCVNGLYITGILKGTAVNFGVTVLTPSATGTDIYIAKLDSNTGAWLWANQSTSTNNSTNIVNGIAVDCQGNIFVTGSINTQNGNMDFVVPSGITVLTAFGNSDAFVAKADALTGQWLIAIQTNSSNTGTNNVVSNAITTDFNGNVFIIGSYTGIVTFGTTLLVSQNISIAFRNAFVSKFNFNLEWDYTLNIAANSIVNPTNNDIGGQAITTDALGNVFLTGYFQGAFDFNETTLTSLVAPSVFVAKLLPNGVFNGAIQAMNINSEGSSFSYGIIANCQGNVYIVGNFTGNVSFGNSNLSSLHTLSSSKFDIFVANVVSDRTIHLTGVAPKFAYKNFHISPLFFGMPVCELFKDLIPAFDYAINDEGDILPFSRPNMCCDPGLVYFGTALNSCELLIKR